MLFVIQRGYNGVKRTDPKNIIYCVTSIAEVINSQIEFIFTDGHAIDSFSTEYSKDQIINIDNILDYNAINTSVWIDENDLDKKRRIEAEFLLRQDLPVNYILGYICYDESSKSKLLEYGINENKIVVKPNCYF